MIEVHLIGYTADLEYLVLDLDQEADGRYRLVVDEDLFATLDEIRHQRREAGRSAGPDPVSLPLPEGAAGPPAATTSPEPPAAWPQPETVVTLDEEPEYHLTLDRVAPGPGTDTADDWPRPRAADTDPAPRAPAPAGGAHPHVRIVDASLEDESAGERVGTGAAPRADPGADAGWDDDWDDDWDEDEHEPFAPPVAPPAEHAASTGEDPPAPDEPEAAPPEPPASPPVAGTDAVEASSPPSGSPATNGASRPPGSRLSPAQIQALLRAGRSARSVAKEAGTDLAWVERWLVPIEEERAQIIRRARAQKLERARLGRSRDPLGEAVRKSLRERQVPDEDVSWRATRRADGRWRVSVRYRHRGRIRTASWRYDPREASVVASSDLALELGWTRPRSRGGSRRSGRGSAEAAGADRPSAKKTSGKKTSGKTSGKRTTGKKTSGKTTGEKASGEKTSTKRGAGKKTSSGGQRKPSTAESTSKSTSKPTGKKRATNQRSQGRGSSRGSSKGSSGRGSGGR